MAKTWNIKLTVADTWIEDGFNLDTPEAQETLFNKLWELLPYAYQEEIKIAVEPAKVKA